MCTSIIRKRYVARLSWLSTQRYASQFRDFGPVVIPGFPTCARPVAPPTAHAPLEEYKVCGRIGRISADLPRMDSVSAAAHYSFAPPTSDGLTSGFHGWCVHQLSRWPELNRHSAVCRPALPFELHRHISVCGQRISLCKATLPSNARRAFLRPANPRPSCGLTASRIIGGSLPVTIASYSAAAHCFRFIPNIRQFQPN